MCFSYRVSLQIKHPEADPQTIAAGIGLPALYRWAAGDERKTPKGTPLTGTYSSSYCVFDLGNSDDGELAQFLRGVVGRLEPAAVYIAELRKTGGKINFFVSWTPGEHGEMFDTELLADIARLGIDLGIEPIA